MTKRIVTTVEEFETYDEGEHPRWNAVKKTVTTVEEVEDKPTIKPADPKPYAFGGTITSYDPKTHTSTITFNDPPTLSSGSSFTYNINPYIAPRSPEYLEGEKQYNKAPIGTIVDNSEHTGGGQRYERRGTGVNEWFDESGKIYSYSNSPYLKRKVIRWGAPKELKTLEDYKNAPVGTIVRFYDSTNNIYTKNESGDWISDDGLYRSYDSLAISGRIRKVVRWGEGPEEGLTPAKV